MKHKKNINNINLFTVYGINNSYSVMNSNNCSIKEIYLSNEFVNEIINEALLSKYSKKIKKVPKDHFKEKFKGIRSQGIVVSFFYKIKRDVITTNNKTNNCYVLLDSVKDPQNLGQIIRTSECAGVSGIIIPERRSVSITDTVLQVSQGAFCNIDLIISKNIKYTINELKNKGYWIVGLENSIESKKWYEINMSGKIGLVFGSEGAGLRQITKKYCDFLATIPMSGKINSLNISATVSAILFERNRQILDSENN